jgi:hypothetical protein
MSLSPVDRAGFEAIATMYGIGQRSRRKRKKGGSEPEQLTLNLE